MESQVIIVEEGVFKTVNVNKNETPPNIAIHECKGTLSHSEYAVPKSKMIFRWYWGESYGPTFEVKFGGLTIKEIKGRNVVNNCELMNHFSNLTDEELQKVILLKQQEKKTELQEEIEALKNELTGLKKKKKSFIQLNSEFEKISNLINEVIKE